MRIEVEYLMGTVYASNGQNEPEWPPHPARLFSALVSVAKEAQMGSAAEDALRWLECQAPPQIRAGIAAETRTPTRFVPPNYPRFREPCHLLPWLRTNQERTFPAQTPTDPVVSFQWPDVKSYPERLEEIVGRMAHLGHSASLVRASLETDLVPPTLVPNPQGEIALGIPTAGRLRELEDCYRLGQRPRPPAFHRYAPVTPEVGTSTHGEMVIMRQVGGLPMPIEATLLLTDSLRNTMISVADGLGFAVAEIHGHDQGKHCAYLALPFAGWEHASNNILGIAVAIPRGIAGSVRQKILRTCAGISYLSVPGFGCWHPGSPGAVPPRTLQESTWRSASTTWVSITPLVLKHRPSQKFDRPLERMIAEYCLAAGLPRPREVRAGRFPFLNGLPGAYEFRLKRKGDDPTEKFAAHAILQFDCAVEGPIILGKQRHFGLGLFRPLLEANHAG